MALDDDATILDLYKLAVEQADRVSSRRATANTYFLTLNTALTAFVAVLTSTEGSASVPTVDTFALVMTSIAGMVLSVAWWLLLRSYRDLNRAKFKVITEMEQEHLPVRIFEREWDHLKQDEPLPWWKGRYAELGFVERTVPIVFFVVYAALGVRVWLR